MRLLVFLRDEALRERIVEHFKPYDCRFDIFTDASMIFDAIYKKIYDVVVLSVEAPHFEALELTKQIRENKIRVPIILISKLHDFTYLKMGV